MEADADEPISDAEEEAAAPAADTVEAIKQAVTEAGQVRWCRWVCGCQSGLLLELPTAVES